MLLLQEELENFPLPIIQMSQAVLNQTRYPSVLLLVCQDKDQHKPDIHFFHCDEVEVSFADLTQFTFLLVSLRADGYCRFIFSFPCEQIFGKGKIIPFNCVDMKMRLKIHKYLNDSFHKNIFDGRWI